MENFNIELYIYANITFDDLFFTKNITKRRKSSTLKKQSDLQTNSQPQPSLYEDSQVKLKPDNEIVRILREKTVLKHAKSFPSQQSIYLYIPDKGHYSKVTTSYIVALLSKIFYHCLSLYFSKPYYPANNTLERLEKLLRVDFMANLGKPIFDRDYLIMENGALNLNTFDLIKHTPDLFQVTAIPYSFDKEATCNKFLTFLHTFCDGKEDRKLFIRSYMRATLAGHYEDQTFLALVGPGGTGKSQLANVFTAIVGDQNSITSGLKELNHDKFEIPLLVDKKLIMVADHEFYKGDTSILKQLIGGDVVRGRKKNSMEVQDLRCFAKIILVGNCAISSLDSGSAMSRRQVAIPAYNISKSREDLLGFDQNNLPKGILADEIPGIAYWALSMDSEIAKSYLINRALLVSLIQTNEEIELLTNPVKTWIKDELEPGPGCPLGFIPNCNSIQSSFEIRRRSLLFPSFLLWCKKQNITEQMPQPYFKTALVDNLAALGYKDISCPRKAAGTFITGVKFQDKVLNVDSFYGGEVNILSSPDNLQSYSSDQNTPPKDSECSSDKELHSKNPDSIQKYIKLFGLSLLKKELNKAIVSYIKDNKDLLREDLVQSHLKTLENPTKEYKTAYSQRCRCNLHSISSFGAIPYTYTRNISPRYTPKNGSMSRLKAVKQVVSSLIAKQVSKQDCTLLQFDIKSCFPSILAGMYPQHLPELSFILKTGLWKSIEDWFHKQGKGHLFLEKSIKSCVHASYFQAGENAMEKIFKTNMAAEKGMTDEEFHFDINNEKYCEIAAEAIKTLKLHPVLIELKNLTNHLSYELEGRVIHGPSGFSCPFTKGKSFISDFSLLIQSYEIQIIALTGLLLKEEYPEIELLEHHHDGFSIIAPKAKSPLIINSCQEKLEEVRKSLGLSYSLKFKHNDLG